MTAYRKKHSCVTALISWVEDWRLALDNKQKALLLSMDMSKAFDLVLPSLTVAKLAACGFNDKSLQLMRSYLNSSPIDEHGRWCLRSWWSRAML